jgi:hypothetical protein
MVSMWRSSSSKTVCSRCTTPSGHVPGGGAAIALGCGVNAVEKEEEEDQGLIMFLFFVNSRVFDAKSQGLVVFSFLFVVLPIKVTPALLI